MGMKAGTGIEEKLRRLDFGSLRVRWLCGLGTMLGPLIGGLALGVVEALGTNLFGSTFENLISFAIFLAVLIFLPKGILGGRKEG